MKYILNKFTRTGTFSKKSYARKMDEEVLDKVSLSFYDRVESSLMFDLNKDVVGECAKRFWVIVSYYVRIEHQRQGDFTNIKT